jgi:predicted nucleic acid-binding protein
MHEEAEALLDSLDVWHMPSVVIHELVWFFKKAAPGVDVLKALLGCEKVVSTAKTPHH